MEDLISVIITIRNGEQFIDDCFKSIIQQRLVHDELRVSLELCVFNDASTDNTIQILNAWKKKFEDDTPSIIMNIINSTESQSKGVGYGRNMSIKCSRGNFICFQDIDDVMFPDRIIKQYQLAKLHPNALIGSKFIRSPENSTCRFTEWANEIPSDLLNVQIYTSHGPTIVMPTWFCHRNVIDECGLFSELGKGTPEDLLYFYEVLDKKCQIMRVDERLVNYKYHKGATTFSVDENTIWNIRMNRLIKKVLKTPPWCNGFTIWNAGKQGRKFFRDLPLDLKGHVQYFCDVDLKKIGKNYDYYDLETRKVIFQIPIIDYMEAKPPIIICMKMNLTNGQFEANLAQLVAKGMKEDEDFIMFS